LYSAQTEKVDVYSLGNIFFTLLTLEEIFHGISSKKVKKRVKKGERPIPVDSHGVWNSTDPIDQALKSAMEMCLIYNVTERATARQVETFLKRKLEEIDPGRLKVWGVKLI
jgi:serine/threonine protein kinase